MSGGVVEVLTAALEDCEWLLSSSVKTMDVSPDQLRGVIARVTELQAAAHAVLTASDLTDVLAAHDRLAAALAACGTVTAPDSDTNNHEAIHGICAQGESE